MNAVDANARRQEVLVRAALLLTSELSLPATLQNIVDMAAEVADARYGALGVLGLDGRIQAFVTHGISDEQRRAIGRLPVGRGILGVLITDAKPLRLRRIQDHPKSVGFPPYHPPMTSFLGVPIAIHGSVFGNLYLTEKRDAGEFSPEDEDAVVKLAAQAAVAIENARPYTEARAGRHRMEALLEITEAMLEGRSSEDLLRLIAVRARELVGAAIAAIATPTGSSGELEISVAEGERAASLEGSRFPSADSISGEVMRTREPLIVADAAGDPRSVQPLIRMGGFGAAMFVPLAVHDRMFGTLQVANRLGERQFSPEDLALVRTFAAQAAVALEHWRIRGELQRLALVEDRERIAKELHDDVIQSLFAEGMALQASLAMVQDPVAVETRIIQSVENIDRVIRDLRNYIFGLRPGVAADRQLDRSLRDLAATFSGGSIAPVHVMTDDQAVSRLAGKAGDVLSAAREAISNAVRHSGASHIAVSLTLAGEDALLEVSDDGAGFDPSQAAGRGHGLANLRDRAQALGGELEIESEPGRGAWVRIRIPM